MSKYKITLYIDDTCSEHGQEPCPDDNRDNCWSPSGAVGSLPEVRDARAVVEMLLMYGNKHQDCRMYGLQIEKNDE